MPVKRGLACLEVGVDQLVDAHVGGGARSAGQVVDVDRLEVVDFDCVQFGGRFDACFQGQVRFETLRRGFDCVGVLGFGERRVGFNRVLFEFLVGVYCVVGF